MSTGTLDGGPPPQTGLRSRIGAVRYMNTTPLIEGLQKLADVDLRLAPPAELIGMLDRDEVDLALASIVDVHRAATPVAIVPVGMIGCDGETRTVRLVSRVPIERISTVHADIESHTSVVLARMVVAWARNGAPPAVVEWDASSPAPWPEAAVVIGDKVNDPRVGGYPHAVDLGEAWKARTGLPFVYAAWMCRMDRTSDPRVRIGAMVLDRQRRHNAMRTDWIVARQAERHGWTAGDASEYLGRLLRYDVSPAHRTAVERFFMEASSLGLIGAGKPVTWADELG